MSKRTRTRPRRTTGGEVNPRQPCPCGSGKRYKACHGGAGGVDDVIVLRPFDGLAAEPELIALREFVPSATAPLTLAEPGERAATLATVLPGASAAMVYADGTAVIGLQVLTRSADVSRDLGRALAWALAAEPGEVLAAAGPDTAGGADIRLQDLLVPDAELNIGVHRDFSWWTAGEQQEGDLARAIETANDAIMPTEPVPGEGVRAAYWTDPGEKAHLRWVRNEPEETLLAALARLAARDELDLGEGSRYAGSFRAHGLQVPVWDLDREMHAREWVAPAEQFAQRLEAALATDEPLSTEQRRARDGLRGRQVTVR